MEIQRTTLASAATGREAPVDLSPEHFRALGHALVDRCADFLTSLPERPVTHAESPSVLRAVLGDAPLAAEGRDPARLLDDAATLLFEHGLFNGHPRFWGYVSGAPAPIGMLGDLLAATVNPNVGSHVLAPMATAMEAQTVRWIAELIGYPATCGGLLVSGGNMANFVGVLAARKAQLPWDVRADGLRDGAGRLRLYCSAQTHTWVQKAADLFGLGTSAIHWLPVDDRLRMDPAALRTAIQADRARGDLPFLVVGTAGSVSTGAVDPLPELAALCREEGLWFHVDGAYGGFAASLVDTPDTALVPAELRGLREADSVAVDPHKWLYAPLEAGCVLVRDPAQLRDAFSYHPAYYHFDQSEEPPLNYYEYGPQNSRGFRALKVWLALQHAGRAGYARMIADDIRLSREMFHRLAAEPEVQTFTNDLSITTFRYVPADYETGEPDAETYLNALNTALLERMQREGEAFVSNAELDGRFLLRACIVNFHTAPDDVAALPGIVVRLGRELDQALRGA